MTTIDRLVLSDKEPAKPFTYTDDEVTQIRQALSGNCELSFALSEKINQDPLYSDCSIAMFFPVVGERIKQGEIPKVEKLVALTRKWALKVSFPDTSFVIKTIENSKEQEVVALISDLGVCPQQYESLPGFVTEAFVEGTGLGDIDPNRCTPEFMEEIGKKIGQMFQKIHERNILINDQVLLNNMGRSHTIIGPDNEVTFIDFGAAVDLSDYPNISDEAIFLIMKSDGKKPLDIILMGDEALPQFIPGFRAGFINQSTRDEAVLRFDGQLIDEGFGFLQYQLPNIDDMVRAYLEVTGGKLI